ncbi:MAG TPA: hypothetical protein VIS48_13300 [Candidatus Kryptonia bacterium]
MFYEIVLATHSAVRWLVLISLLYAIFRGAKGWMGGGQFTHADGVARLAASVIVRVQFVVGVALYILSPITAYFVSDIRKAMDFPEVRFFGLEHVAMTVIAIGLISIGEIRSKKAPDDKKKFSRMTIFYVIALLVILAAIPWPFSHSSRPLFRPF